MSIIYFILLLECLIPRDTADGNTIDYSQNSSLSDRNGIPINKTVSYLPIQYFKDTTKYIYQDQEGDTWELIYTDENKHDSLIENSKGVFRMEIDSSWVQGILRVLTVAEEPLLYNYFLEREIYRFTWLRTFHEPVVIKVIKETVDNIILTTKIIKDGEVMSTEKSLTLSQWTDLKSRLEQTNYWHLPVYEQKQMVNDGASWTLESHQNDGYYVVSRRSPVKSGFREVCEYLIRLSDAKDEEVY